MQLDFHAGEFAAPAPVNGSTTGVGAHMDRGAMRRAKPTPTAVRSPSHPESAVENFRGLGRHLAAERKLRNIRLSDSGYQVVLTRDGVYTSRCFAGYSEESLQAAMRFRDGLLAKAPRGGHPNPIPQEVLDALGLKEPVLGVADCPYKRAFRVSLRGIGRYEKPFYYRRVPKAEAYAAAVAFREELLAQVHGEGGLGAEANRIDGAYLLSSKTPPAAPSA